MLAGAGAHVDDPVGRAHGVFVVLDHDQGVAQVAQPLQRVDQPRVVALVQADARLVQDVQHAHQAGADLGRQPDALRLAAARACRRRGRGQIVQADVDQEAQAAPDLLQDLAGDREVAIAERLTALGRPPIGRVGVLGRPGLRPCRWVTS